MPSLDVSDAFDADFLDTISVIRRLQVESSKGRASTTDAAPVATYAVVCPASGSDLERLEDYDISKKYISVVTQYRLQLASTGTGGATYKNDVVLWAGTYFEVITLDDASRFGQGFVEAICASIDYQDAPPTP
jgi:hypothetical protein